MPPTALSASDLLPIPAHAIFSMSDHYVWCGAPTRSADGTYHLLFSRWSKNAGFQAWVTHSQIAHAESPRLLGPYRFTHVILPPRENHFWDAHVSHNPTVLHIGNKFYLYYTGNYGQPNTPHDQAPSLSTGEVRRFNPYAENGRDHARWWIHRNHQRIGVAVADHPAGPWQRFDQPLIDVDPTSWHAIIAANPAVTPTPDGRFLMMYKTVAPGPPPFGGKVLHAIALADSPTGPFITQPDPVLTHPTAQFPAEDPFIWHDGTAYHAIVKDMQGYFTHTGQRSLALFTSPTGTDWHPAPTPLISTLELHWQNRPTQPVHYLERPQLYLEQNIPQALFCAVMPTPDESTSFNVAIPLAPPR